MAVTNNSANIGSQGVSQNLANSIKGPELKRDKPQRPAEAVEDMVADTGGTPAGAVPVRAARPSATYVFGAGEPMQQAQPTERVAEPQQQPAQQTVTTTPQAASNVQAAAPQSARPSVIAANISTGTPQADSVSSGSGYETDTDNSVAGPTINWNLARTDASKKVARIADAAITQRMMTPPPAQTDEVEPTPTNQAKTVEEDNDEDERAVVSAERTAAIPEGPREVQAHSLPSMVYKHARDRRKKIASALVASKSLKGSAIVEKMMGDRNLMPDEVSIGMDVIREMIRQPRNNFISVVETISGKQIDLNSDTWEQNLMDIVNDPNFIMNIGVYKSPVNRSSSAQKRILRIHPGRGAKLHPTQAKSFNADFDGDDATCVFNEKKIRSLKPAMSFLIDVDGSCTLDPDFFPLPKLRHDNPGDRNLVRKMFKRRISTEFLDSIMDICYVPETEDEIDNTPPIEDRMAAYARALFKETKGDYRKMSKMLKQTYDGLQEILMIKAEVIASQEPQSLYEVPASTTSDYVVADVLKDMAAGTPPMNFQAFKTAMNKYIGSEDNKNISFRIGADMAKMIKYNGNLHIGNDEDFYELYQCTMAMGVSLRISGLASLEDKAVYATQMLKSMILQEVGMPSQYNSINDFLQKFYEVYQDKSDLMDIANVEFLTDFTSQTGKTPITTLKDDSISSIVPAFEKVYGQFTMGELFGRFAKFDYDREREKNDGDTREKWTSKGMQYILIKYRDMELREFTRKNTVKYNTESDITKHSGDRVSSVSMNTILNILADRRSSKGSKYNKTLMGKTDGYGKVTKEGLLSKMSKAINDINLLRSEKIKSGTGESIQDWKRFSDDLVELLYSTSQDLFDHFGMIDADSFLNSKYGKALLATRSADAVGGVRITMMIEQRMSRVTRAEKRFRELVEDSRSGVDAIANSANKAALEIDALASSSLAWHAIVEERLDGRAWNDLTSTQSNVINSFRGDNQFLSNFYPCKITMNIGGTDYTFSSAEAAFQAHKDPANASRFVNISAKEAKSLGRKVSLRKDWDSVKVSVMESVVRAKFAQNEDLMSKLKNTGNSVLVEGNTWGDSFWGVSNGSGSNFLGRILENVRGVKGIQSNTTTRSRLKNSTLNAGNFWDNPTHDSLYEFLMDVTVGKELKEAVLSDIVRWHESFDGIKAFEMTYQLEQGQNSLYNRLGVTDQTNILDALEDADDRFDSYSKKDYNAALKNIEDAYSKYGKKVGTLERALDTAAKDPTLLVKLDDRIVGDAISSVLDKTFAVGEKSGQMPGPDALYQGLVLQKNGCFQTDVARGDDRAIGLLRWDSLTMQDVVYLLANNNNSLEVYDWNGNRTTLSRDILCGVDNATEADVWSFLRRNPRIALCLRQHQVSTICGKDTKSFLTAVGNTSDFIARGNSDRRDIFRNKVKMKLHDDPRFHAMAALIVPLEYRTSRTTSTGYIKAEKYLAASLVKLADETRSNLDNDEGGNIDKNKIEEIVEDMLGVTKDQLRTMGKTFEEGDEVFVGIQGDVIHDLYEYIADTIEDLIDDINDIRAEGHAYKPKSVPDFAPQTDYDSVAAFFDVMQELSGAKTAVSTGIEGTETHKLATWMALLAPQDTYDIADGMPEDETTELLNGCLTSVVKNEETGEFYKIGDIPLSELSDLAGEDGIVVQVPPGFVVKDQMLDSHGRQVSSVNRFLVVKRDKGAEEFNLKIKKFGVDDSHSITKHDKYGNTEYDQLLDTLKQTFVPGNPEALFRTRLILAKHLMEENEQLGYKDMDLANYMSISDLMLVEIDGELCLRSLEQIAYAIKYRLDKNLVEDGSIEDVRSAARAIADNVGTEESMADPIDLLSSIKVCGTSRFKPVIRPYSSSWHRNYDLMKEIREETGQKRLTDDQVRGVMGKDKSYLSKYGYRLIGRVTKEGFKAVYSIGPTDAIMIEGGSTEDIVRALDHAYNHGNAVVVPYNMFDRLPEEYQRAVVPFGEEEAYILPMFDMRLNGSEAWPHDPTAQSWQCSPTRVVYGAESQLNEYRQGDSDVKIFKSLTDRTTTTHAGTTSVSSGDLFRTAFADNPDSIFKVELMTGQDVHAKIINGYGNMIFDPGTDLKTSWADEDQERMDARIEKFREHYERGEVNNDGVLTRAAPDEIVAWAKCTVWKRGEGEKEYIAPIIPFRIEGSHSVPNEFLIVDGYDFGVATGKTSDDKIIHDKSAFNFQWTYAGGVEGEYVKMHEPGGAANKLVGVFSTEEGPQLKTGRPIDIEFAAATTSSRRGGTLKRMATMNTLMFQARMEPYGFNFAEADGAFDGSPDLKEEFLNHRFTRDKWREILDNDVIIHSDPEMNRFCRFMVNKCLYRNINPSDFFGSVFNGSPSHVWFEFESVYEQAPYYEDMLLKFLHLTMPTLCPDGLNGDWIRCLFKPDKDGCLQMMRSHKSAKKGGGTFWTWENIYAGWGFFGEDFSGMKMPSLNGASQFMDAINTLALEARDPNGFSFRRQMEWATSDMGGYNMPYGIEPDLGVSRGED